MYPIFSMLHSPQYLRNLYAYKSFGGLEVTWTTRKFVSTLKCTYKNLQFKWRVIKLITHLGIIHLSMLESKFCLICKESLVDWKGIENCLGGWEVAMLEASTLGRSKRNLLQHWLLMFQTPFHYKSLALNFYC